MHTKMIVEFIGTFFLVLTIGMTVIGSGAGVIPPLAIGGILMVMVYAGGHVSGAHYNPAVTFGLWIRKKLALPDCIPYWISQFAGAAAATAIVTILKGGEVMGQVAALKPVMAPALIAEFLFTFALVYVVLNVATSKGTSGNSFYGIAIGTVVLAGAFAVGGVSGGAFNPAVVLGASMLGLLPWNVFVPYVLAQFVAAAAAAVVFRSTARE